MRRLSALFLLAFIVSSCASVGLPQHACETLYFGTGKADGSVVTESEWSAFGREVLSREFPNGLTTWEADGEWRGSDGRLVVERSHVVFVYGADDAAIKRVIDEYKRRFVQEAVMRVSSPCVARF